MDPLPSPLWYLRPRALWQAAALTLFTALALGCASHTPELRVDLHAIPDTTTFQLALPEATPPEAPPLVITGLPGPLEPAQPVILTPPDWPEDDPPILAWTQASNHVTEGKAQLLLLAATPEKDIPPGALIEPIFTPDALLDDALDKRVARVLEGSTERPRVDRGALHAVAPDDVYALVDDDAPHPARARPRALFAVDDLGASDATLRLIAGDTLPSQGARLILFGHLPAPAERTPEIVFILPSHLGVEQPLPGLEISAADLIERARRQLPDLDLETTVDHVVLPRDQADPLSAWLALETHAITVTLTERADGLTYAHVATPLEAPFRIACALPTGALPLSQPELLDLTLAHALLLATGRPQVSLTLRALPGDDPEALRRVHAIHASFHAAARYALGVAPFGRHVRLDLQALPEHALSTRLFAAQLALAHGDAEAARVHLEADPGDAPDWLRAHRGLLRVRAALARGDLVEARARARELADAPSLLAAEAISLAQATERDVAALHPTYAAAALEARGHAIEADDPAAAVTLLEAAAERFEAADMPARAARARARSGRALHADGRVEDAITRLLDAGQALDTRHAHRDAGNAWLRATLWMLALRDAAPDPELAAAQLHAAYAAAHDAFAAAHLPRKLAATHLVGSQLLTGEDALDALVAATLYAHIAADPEQLAAAELALAVTLAQQGAALDALTPHLERAQRFADIADAPELSRQLQRVRQQLQR